MSEERRGDNGAAVAIVVALGTILFLGLVVVVGVGAIFFVRISPAPAPVLAMPPQAVVTNSAPQTGVAESAAPVVPRLPVEINAQDQLLVSGEATTLDELKATLKDMKNGNSAFAEITVKFAGCSPAKMGETIALLKEACVFYEVDPAGDRPAEDTATP